MSYSKLSVIAISLILSLSWANFAYSSELAYNTRNYMVDVKNGNLAEIETAKELMYQYLDLGKASNGAKCVASVLGSPEFSNGDMNYYATYIVVLSSNCQHAADRILESWRKNPLIDYFLAGEAGPFPSVTLIN